MRRARKAIVHKEKVTRYVYSVICPHCHTTLVGGFGEDTMKMKCSQCSEAINLIHFPKQA